MKKKPTFTDETNITDLEIAPDGRVFVFGASPEVLRILDNLCSKDQSLRARVGPSRRRKTKPVTTVVANRSVLEGGHE